MHMMCHRITVCALQTMQQKWEQSLTVGTAEGVMAEGEGVKEGAKEGGTMCLEGGIMCLECLLEPGHMACSLQPLLACKRM